MTPGADNEKSSGLDGFSNRFDVRSPARHVGGDGYRTVFSGTGDDFRFAFVMLCVENFMGDVLAAQHSADCFGHLDGNRSD